MPLLVKKATNSIDGNFGIHQLFRIRNRCGINDADRNDAPASGHIDG